MGGGAELKFLFSLPASLYHILVSGSCVTGLVVLIGCSSVTFVVSLIGSSLFTRWVAQAIHLSLGYSGSFVTHCFDGLGRVISDCHLNSNYYQQFNGSLQTIQQGALNCKQAHRYALTVNLKNDGLVIYKV